VMVAHGTRLPPPRPGVRHVRLWKRGIVIADDELRDRVDRFFHWPMIVLALATLPLLAIELTYLDQAPEHEKSWLGVLCWIGFGVIWLAFLIEFIVKILIAECRVEYVKRNWLDVIIIVLPALRPLRATSIVRTSRVFQLRGVGMKCVRYLFTIIIGLETTERMLERIGWKLRRDRLDPARMTRHQLTQEVRRLRRISDAWETWYEAHVDYEHEKNRTVPEPPVVTADEGDDREGPLAASRAPAGG